MVSISPFPAPPRWTPPTAAQQAGMSESTRRSIQAAEASQASADEVAKDLANGTAVISAVELKRVDLSKYTFAPAGSGKDPLDSIKPTYSANHEASYGSVQQVDLDRITGVISKLAEDIGGGYFNKVEFNGANNGVLTHSPVEFLGWLKDRQASLTLGGFISQTA